MLTFPFQWWQMYIYESHSLQYNTEFRNHTYQPFTFLSSTGDSERARNDELQWNGPLQSRHNRCDSVSNHHTHDCLLNQLFRRRSKKTLKLRVTGLCAGNSPGTGEFPAQKASNAENVSIWWRHHAKISSLVLHCRSGRFPLRYGQFSPKLLIIDTPDTRTNTKLGLRTV